MSDNVYARNKASGIVTHVPDWYLTREPYASLYEPATQEDYQCVTCGVPPEPSTPVPTEELEDTEADEIEPDDAP